MVQLEFYQAGQVVEVGTVSNFFTSESMLLCVVGQEL